jgi:hypothetical protein
MHSLKHAPSFFVKERACTARRVLLGQGPLNRSTVRLDVGATTAAEATQQTASIAILTIKNVSIFCSQTSPKQKGKRKKELVLFPALFSRYQDA